MQNLEVQMNQNPIARVESDLESLIPSFLNNRKKDIVDLRAYVATSDFKNMERIGHILKGVSASYGFEKLGEYGARLETSAKAQLGSDCGEIVELIAIYMRDVVVVYE